MKKFIIVFTILISFCLSAQQKHKIAILNYEDRSRNLEENILSTATDYLRMYFEGQNTYAVIPKDQQNNLTPQAANCEDKLCRVQTGQTLKAEIVAYPYITSGNEQYVITVEIINVARRNTVISVSENWNGNRASLDSISEAIVSKIVAKQTNIDALNSNTNLFQAIDQQQQEQKKIIETAAKDAVSCDKARKKQSDKEWKNYLKKFPDGQCAGEAKTFIAEYDKKQDTEACEKARKDGSLKGWEKYLKEFPNGLCAEEAKILLDKDACEEAKALPEKIKKRAWEKYLKEFPEGQCAEEAKKFLEN